MEKDKFEEHEYSFKQRLGVNYLDQHLETGYAEWSKKVHEFMEKGDQS